MRRSLVFLVWMLGVCSMLGMLAPLYWMFDLFNHFRLHAVVASVVLAGMSCFFDKRLAVVCLLILAFNSFLVFERLHETEVVASFEGEGKTKPISIIASNVYTPNHHHAAVLSMVQREKPDIVVFTETNDRWVQELGGLLDEYAYHVEHPRPDNFGMAIYSRLPFRAEILSVGEYALPLGVLTFDHFTLLAAHPIPPVSYANMLENRLYLEKIAQIAREQSGAVVVAGDLNSTLWSHSIKPLFASGLRRVSQSGFAYTWPTQMPVFAMQIDHFFAKQISFGDAEVLEAIGSDHFPIQARMMLQEK